MAFEAARSDNIHQGLYSSTSRWPSMRVNTQGHRYSSVNPDYEYPMQTYPKSSRSIVSESEYSQQDHAYSSRTSILQADGSNTRQKSDVAHRRLETPWQPGFWARFPWLGVLGLTVTVLATGACVVVLARSNGVPIDEWNGYFQPTVYLSICTALANVTLTYAMYHGVVISFWRKACEGATLTELHLSWHSGSSLWGALQGLLRLRGKATAFACIVTVLSIGRGPLMQRASLVKNKVILQDGNMTMYSALQLPAGYAGRSIGRASAPSLMNPNFTEIVQAHTSREDIAGLWKGCNSTCYTEVKGFGFGVSCNTSGLPYSLDPIMYPNGTYKELRNATEVFSVDAGEFTDYDHGGNIESSGWKYSAALLLNATFMGTPTNNTSGDLVEHVCALRGGIVSYPIVINNGTIAFQSPSWTNDTFLEDRGFAPLLGSTATNIAGFILAAKSMYYGTADLQFGGGVGYVLQTNGASANGYLERPDPTKNYYIADASMTWRDPMEDMINTMREIAFRTALQIASVNTTYPNATQIVPFTGNVTKTVYTVNPTFMWCAVALSLFGVIAVIPTYHGFWMLGRHVTLSPLEIAKAFGAPLLVALPGNQPAKDMLGSSGKTKIRYGDSGHATGANIYSGGEEVRKIGMGPIAEVRPPQKGAKYM